ncbi:hypothetical protein [Methylocystis iwaonis]|nr:hypothetical protein [Methylocystis iwaonis]
MSMGMKPGPMTMPTWNGAVPCGDIMARSFSIEGTLDFSGKMGMRVTPRL